MSSAVAAAAHTAIHAAASAWTTDEQIVVGRPCPIMNGIPGVHGAKDAAQREV